MNRRNQASRLIVASAFAVLAVARVLHHTAALIAVAHNTNNTNDRLSATGVVEFESLRRLDGDKYMPLPLRHPRHWIPSFPIQGLCVVNDWQKWMDELVLLLRALHLYTCSYRLIPSTDVLYDQSPFGALSAAFSSISIVHSLRCVCITIEMHHNSV